ncbi:hypothetical protein PG990_014636 [Apiospora arundinis]
MVTDRHTTGDQRDGDGTKRQLTNEAYKVGWVCAISTEYVAARAFLDDEYESPEHKLTDCDEVVSEALRSLGAL